MVTLHDEQAELPYVTGVVPRETRRQTSARTYRLVSHRWELVRDVSFRTLTQHARLPSDAAQILLDRIGSEARECFAVLPLTTRSQILAVDVIATGTVNACLVTPADVYRRALAHADAVACIVGHNHPSGDVTPSAEDRALTAKLKRAGDVIGIALLDHVIVSAIAGRAAPRYWSFQDHGEM